MFDAITYTQNFVNTLTLTKDKYLHCQVNGVSNLEAVLQESKRNEYFFAIDDNSEDGDVFKGAGYGHFDKRMYTIFILGKISKATTAQAIKAEAKTIFEKFLAMIIKDKHGDDAQQFRFLNTDHIRYHEFPGLVAYGCAGLFFSFSIDNPINLVYDADDYE